ncbi:LacI family DNA-binding transcriptional regulator [Paenibacillus vulneris]|uniref:LacI family DNA-binding transcriptional regulator n=1 Tax=Paenibacillus vulneris TaxID=1133364 RepID=A0ABW3UIK4_9BACL
MNKRVTSFDVAKRAGVSRSVVSAVLNGTPGIGVSEEKRKLVLEVIRELNYQVDAQARGMKTGRSHCLAAYGNVSNPMFLQVLEGMQEVCASQGYHVLLYPSGSSQQRQESMLDLFLQRRIDGIMALDRPHRVDEEWVQTVHQYQLPYVSVEGYHDHSGIPSVLMDYEESVHRALDFMWERTRLMPAYLELRHPTPLGWGDQERRKAYEGWAASHGVEPLIFTETDGPWIERAQFWTQWTREFQPLSRVLLTNWSRGAVYVSRAAQMLGMQPGKDIHLMACDNTERINQHLFPAITSIEVPYREMGRLAAQRLLEYVEGRRGMEDKSGIWVKAMLEERESVGRLT